uniref:pyridoxal 5'-phosphate synthase (glutamine hydrolyzing) n=1 Tax=Leptocylindrus danicus TaxID=163516 RepID=A0A6U2RGK3_9STRA|mmetsp:Transcript_34226/g.49689  ORF Transcript_34226/g.49689 Transcript_34226/m.49689 type:complete len:338 (+) Transcript_34226:151-1164(+)|eukprot:CAMPEP_0116034252 /NCGR_PEP_ID=MMETSP0321-20121206/19490_1 /TAXON_ID=163516 /ORGANISM="Leptocylindrus danicus var. danicus, Strain B650" /LENGTH=337 /DNA_ID=CAMNT_0003510515 /DNA_START=75 /DNA_END=1088 /DNA_ORIENTATION=-
MSTTNGHAAKVGTNTVKQGLAQMLKGGVIMDVMNVEQAKIAEEAGAVAVMALERIPADIRRNGGVARMSDPCLIAEIKSAVTIPVMAKARIGHFVEAQVLEACEIDYIDESEVLTMADDVNHIDKTKFTTPFVCGCRNLGEALRRVTEGAAMLRTKGEAGTGNIVEAVRHARTVMGEIKKLTVMSEDELFVAAKQLQAPYELVKQVAATGKLPIVNFAAGGVATPADAALMMQLGMDGVFVGSGIFKSEKPEARARAIVQAVTHYQDAKVIMEVSKNLGAAMVGVSDIQGDSVNFRDREGASSNSASYGVSYGGQVPPKVAVTGHTETQLYGSSWKK